MEAHQQATTGEQMNHHQKDRRTNWWRPAGWADADIAESYQETCKLDKEDSDDIYYTSSKEWRSSHDLQRRAAWQLSVVFLILAFLIGVVWGVVWMVNHPESPITEKVVSILVAIWIIGMMATPKGRALILGFIAGWRLTGRKDR